MNLTVLSVGKLKEAFFRDACREYQKRLSRFVKLSVIEVPDIKIPENASPKEEEKVRVSEGKTLLSRIKPSDFVIALCVEGKQKSSEELAAFLSDCALSGKSDLTFIIGGSLGLSDEVKQRADLRLGVSRMTFPHQLFRIMLLEQLYRACKINHGESYHK